MIRGNGEWKDVSWPEAIAFTADKASTHPRSARPRQRRRARLRPRHERGELSRAKIRARRPRHKQRRLLRARLPCADRRGDEDDARHRRGDKFFRRHRAGARDSALRHERDGEPPDRRRAHQAGGFARRETDRDRSAQDRAGRICRRFTSR